MSISRAVSNIVSRLRALGAGHGLRGRLRALGRNSSAELGPTGQFRASCQVAQLLSGRLGMGANVRRALWHAFERWDGRGEPEHVRGNAIETAARVVLVAQDAIVLQRVGGVSAAVETLRSRSGRAYDPGIAQAFCAEASALFDDIDHGSAWQRVLDCEPSPRRVLASEALDSALEAVAD